MRMGCFSISFVYLSLASVVVLADTNHRVSYEGHAKVLIQVENQAQIDWLEANHVDIWTHGLGIGEVEARVSPEQREGLDAQGFRYDILNPNLGPQVEAEYARLQGDTVKRGGGFDYLEYHPYETIVDYLNTLAATHPEKVEVMSFGQTIQLRDVWGIKITSGDGRVGKPEMLFFACEHAREWLTPPVPLFTADYLLNGYGTDPRATELLDRVDWYIVPVMNPDGYIYSWDSDRYWRKNRRDNTGPTFGVDINRNWPKEWGGSGSSGDAGSETYRGTAPLSEPETNNMYNFLLDHPNVRAYMDMHSYGELVMWPWAYTTALCPDDDALREVGEAMRDAIASVHNNTYTVGPVGSTLYLAAGASIDSAYDLYTNPFIYSYTIEVRGFDFVMPPTEILPNSEENMEAILTLVDMTTAALEITLPVGAPTLLSPTSPTAFAVEIVPVTESIVAGSEKLYYRSGADQEFIEADLTPVTVSTYEAALPAMSCSAAPEFYVSAQGSGGTFVTNPAGAPEFVYSADVGNLLETVSDDFESDNGWSVSGNAADGHWTRGVPAGDGVRGDPTVDADGSGQCWLTDNVAGNSDVDGGSTTLTSPVFDLAELLEPRVGYARWYFNNLGQDPQNDVFTVEVSDNGGESWVTLEIVGPSGDETVGGWFDKDFSIADFVTPGAEFQIRFTASDTGGGTAVEAGVDAFVLSETICEGGVCEGDANGDGQVDPLDAGYVQARFGCAVGAGDADCDAADVNGDIAVDPLDAGYVLARFGECG